jgi:hypothetical protein
MKKFLIVSGCSWGDPNFISAEHPDMDTSWKMWPEIVSEKLDMQLINLCKSGQGQEYIYSTILDTVQEIPASEIGLVIPAWTTAPRRDYQPSGFSNKRQIWTADQFDWRGCIEYWIDKSIRHYYSFQCIMEFYRIPYKQIQMISLYTGYMWEQFKRKGIDVGCNETKLHPDNYTWAQNYKKLCREQVLNSPYFNKINNTGHFLNWGDGDKVFDADVIQGTGTIERISKLDAHPNGRGQQQIAEFIYDRLG